jgi:hypothetical protein
MDKCQVRPEMAEHGIYVEPDNLSSNLCKEIMKRFDNDPGRYPGITGGGYNPEIKRTMDLVLSRHSHWADVDRILYEHLSDALRRYLNCLQVLNKGTSTCTIAI